MEKKKIIIDKSKWRTGEYGEYQTGAGSTYLLNPEGYMCCLGFICNQMGAPENDLRKCGEPSDLHEEIEGLCSSDNFGDMYNSTLSEEAILINDDEFSTVEEKIDKLHKLFKDSPYELEFVDLIED